MLAVVKAPRTDKPVLEIKGEIPGWLIDRLKEEYRENLVLRDEDYSVAKGELVSVFENEWFKSIDSQITPADNIRIYRENAGLTQTELGKKLGNIPRQNISAMEKGKRGISKEMARKLSEVFKVPVSRFI